MTKFLISIDLGTTNLKVSQFGDDGTLVALKSHEYPILSPKVSYAEQNPNEWSYSLLIVRDYFAREFPEQFKKIYGVGLCGQMHTKVYLDGSMVSADC